MSTYEVRFTVEGVDAQRLKARLEELFADIRRMPKASLSNEIMATRFQDGGFEAFPPRATLDKLVDIGEKCSSFRIQRSGDGWFIGVDGANNGRAVGVASLSLESGLEEVRAVLNRPPQRMSVRTETIEQRVERIAKDHNGCTLRCLLSDPPQWSAQTEKVGCIERTPEAALDSLERSLASPKKPQA
jgi:hypothetical protein